MTELSYLRAVVIGAAPTLAGPAGTGLRGRTATPSGIYCLVAGIACITRFP